MCRMHYPKDLKPQFEIHPNSLARSEISARPTFVTRLSHTVLYCDSNVGWVESLAETQSMVHAATATKMMYIASGSRIGLMQGAGKSICVAAQDGGQRSSNERIWWPPSLTPMQSPFNQPAMLWCYSWFRRMRKAFESAFPGHWSVVSCHIVVSNRPPSDLSTPPVIFGYRMFWSFVHLSVQSHFCAFHHVFASILFA